MNGAAEAQAYVGDPINTRNGNFDYSVVDLSLQTVAGRLTFQRSYASGATGIYTGGNGMGYGWTHNQSVKLLFETGTVWFKAHTANMYKFYDDGNHVYTPYPGVTAQLSYNSGSQTYTLIASDQSTYTFDSGGKLTNWRNELGYGFDYTYASSKLSRVTEPVSGRYLQLNYTGDRLTSVMDHTGRSVSFGYDGNLDLTSFTDAMGNTWTYVYDDSHRLRLVKDPQDQAVVHTEYDAQGRAYRQYDDESLEKLTLELGYNANGTTTVSETLDGKVITSSHTYDDRKTLIDQTNAQGSVEKTYDNNFHPKTITDPLSHITQLTWSSDGANLTRMVDASGVTTTMTYDGLNNLTSLTDGLGYTTVYSYTGTLLRSSTNEELETIVYTYTTAADAPQPPGLLKAVEDPNQNLTRYTNNAYGERIAITDSLDRATYYQYNDQGWLEKVTTPDAKSDWTCYDAAGRTVRRVMNASEDGSTPETSPCDTEHYLPSSDPTYDRISSTVYDSVGNAIANIDAEGRITRTYYDNRSHPVQMVRNLSGWQIDNPSPPPPSLFTNQANLSSETVYDLSGRTIASHEWLVEGSQVISRTTRTYYDLLGRPEYVTQNFVGDLYASNPPAFDPNFPDRNVTTRTYYDAAGNNIAIKDPLGRITRTYYDALNRPSLVAQSWSGTDVYSPTPPTCNHGEGAETNVCSETFYDAVGNVIATQDARGAITRTYYDKARRPTLTVQHLTSQSYNISSPPSSVTFGNDHDVATGMVYDEGGRTIASVEWLVQGGQTISHTTRTYYDPLNRPYLVVQNLDPAHDMFAPVPPSCNRDATGSVEPLNICLETVYHPENGNAIATIDPLGRVARTYYDNLDRPVMLVRNLTSQSYSIDDPPTSSSFGNDHDVATNVIYDDQGNAIANVEWLVENGEPVSHLVRTFYDELDRPVSVARNFVGELSNPQPPAYDPAFPDRNLRTDMVYSSNGTLLASIEWIANSTGQAITRTTRTYYDGLGRVTKVVKNLNPEWGWTNPEPPTCNRDTTGTLGTYNVCQETGYDAAGEMISSTNALGHDTGYIYDPLGRLETVIDPMNHQTSYVYDANGNRVKITDAEEVATRYEYDELDRLEAVVENYLYGVTPDHETNVRTEYSYDALGNRLSILDGNDHTTSFSYDALGRLESETDALGHQWSYRYDVAGNRVGLLDANQATTIYGYDGLYRLKSIDYPDPDAGVSYDTNALGWRTIMTDGLGVTAWQYDGVGRAVAITHPISGTVGYHYDAQGNRRHLIYPDGKTVSYNYDLLDQLSNVEDWDSQVVTYTYDVAGHLIQTQLPNGVVSSYQYNPSGLLEELRHERGEDLLSSFVYQYDQVSNRTAVTETIYLLHRFLHLPVVLKDSSGGDKSAAGGDDAKEEDLTAPNPVKPYPVPFEATPMPEKAYPTPTAAPEEQSSFWRELLGWIGDLLAWITPQASAHAETAQDQTLHLASLQSGVTAGDIYTTTIAYEYDPLYRLTQASYSTGEYFIYTHDAVGNRLIQQTLTVTNTYSYNAANLLTAVDGVIYTWDANGNLLSDGVNTYAYDKANRLKSVTGASLSTSYAYNGLGDRVQQTVNGLPESYALDIASGLTQVLEDGTDTFLYGMGRVAQQGTTGIEYFLGDALSSVRQLVDGNGEATLAKSYEPYGDVMISGGNGTSKYGYTGEWIDTTGLVYLRARYYMPWQGRFVNKDPWKGNILYPLTQNNWSYVTNNPINFSDPSGYISSEDSQHAEIIRKELEDEFSIYIIKDWGQTGLCRWVDGKWSIEEPATVKRASYDLAAKFGGVPNFVQKLGKIEVDQSNISNPGEAEGQHVTFWDRADSFSEWTVVHEFAHVWDIRNHWQLSIGLEIYTGGYTNPGDRPQNCDPDNRLPGCNNTNYFYGGVPAHGSDINFNRREDFAESVTAYVYPLTAQRDIDKYLKSEELRGYLYYANYTKTMRWIYVHGLITGTIDR